MIEDIFSFYKGKKVLVTGHTGFKGSWLCRILINAGASVTGYATEPPTNPNLFSMCEIEERMCSVIGDIRNREYLMQIFDEHQPEIVFHLAAQPIVRDSYRFPVYTYETNVLGTVNVCEAVRTHASVRSFLNVTTDKVYKNLDCNRGYQEDDPLDGYDPYSNSKSCSELITHSYIHSFYCSMDVAASTARAGNVIGGGDFANDRIIPDCIRAAVNHHNIVVRNPHSVRPYQHVLEPLYIYLLIAMKQYQDRKYAGYYNVGPDDRDCVTTGELAGLFCEAWGENIKWVEQQKCSGALHEAAFLKLDCSRIKRVFGWRPKWNIAGAVNKTVEWTKVYYAGQNVATCMDRQIREFFQENCDGEVEQ